MNILLAAHQGDFDTVRQLLSAGEDVDARDEDGLTPLHGACIHGDPTLIRLLVENGAEPDVKDGDQRNPHRLENEVAFNLNALMKLSGKSAPYVFRLESVLTLPENAIEAVRNGKLNKTRVQDFLEDIGDS